MPGHYEKDYYLEAMLIASEGIIALAWRYAAEAERLAGLEKNPRRKKELLEIAKVCRRVPEHPAPTFREALAVLLFLPYLHIHGAKRRQLQPGTNGPVPVALLQGGLL